MIARFLSALPTLDADTLRLIIGEAQAVLSEREAAPLPGEDEDEPEESGQRKRRRRGSGGSWIDVKMVGDNGPYAYRRWREGKVKKSQYLGKVENRG